MWPLRVAVFLLCFTGCWGQSCNGTKAYFVSRNFFSVLHWDPVDVPSQPLLYSVQYNSYGSPYQPVTWCQNISTPVCDMTGVMTQMMTAVISKYDARVIVGERCVGTAYFMPFLQTTFTAPQLSVTSNQTHLNVTVSSPMFAWNRTLENVNFWGGQFLSSFVEYSVRLTHPKSMAGKVFVNTSRSLLIWLVETDVQYCGEVLYKLTHPSTQYRPSENATFCVTVSAPNSWLHILIWPSLLALLLLIVIPIMLCELSVKKKRSLPKSLKFRQDSISPVLCPDSDDISKVEVGSGFSVRLEPQLVFYLPKKMDNNAYASQEHCGQECIPVQDSPESSVHYSTCVPAQTQPSSHETSSDSFDPESISSFLRSSPDTENNSGPLVVPVRDAKNGELQFPDCLFQCGLHSPSPSQDSEGSSGEQTPLLSDLVQNNSRCSSSYLPVHVSEAVTSNYRQNWFPGTPLEGQQDQRTYVKRAEPIQDSPEPNEDFTDEEETKFGVIFLDRMVEMQGLTLSCN